MSVAIICPERIEPAFELVAVSRKARRSARRPLTASDFRTTIVEFSRRFESYAGSGNAELCRSRQHARLFGPLPPLQEESNLREWQAAARELLCLAFAVAEFAVGSHVRVLSRNYAAVIDSERGSKLPTGVDPFSAFTESQAVNST